MTSSKDQRFSQIEETYIVALRNYYEDMAATTSREEARLVDKNYNNAEGNYLDAQAAALTRNGEHIEVAFKTLKETNKTITELRSSSAKISETLIKTREAIGLGKTLIEIASPERENDASA